jgi:flagellar motility protein MotE (MotC chaperone)
VTDEKKNKEDAEVKEPQEKKAGPLKAERVKYILFGLTGIVLVVVIAFATLLFMGDTKTESAPEDARNESAEVNVTDDHDGPHEPESLGFEELDQSVIDVIMENLAILDYEPKPSDLEENETGMSAEDSVEAVNWLEQEKTVLAQKENELDTRQKELERLDKQVTQKILRIEQAESARVASLAKLYDGMDPRAVAKLMGNLDDETVVSILPRMKIKNASAVLQLLPAPRAAKLSKQMITIAEK